MKKVKIQGKLSLDKMTISKLNDPQTQEIVGGGPGFLSIGVKCSKTSCKKNTRGIWCGS